MRKIPLKMNDTKNPILIIHFNFMKKIPLKLTTQKNQILVIHFKLNERNPQKKINDPKKSNSNNPFQFTREIQLKVNNTKN